MVNELQNHTSAEHLRKQQCFLRLQNHYAVLVAEPMNTSLMLFYRATMFAEPMNTCSSSTEQLIETTTMFPKVAEMNTSIIIVDVFPKVAEIPGRNHLMSHKRIVCCQLSHLPFLFTH